MPAGPERDLPEPSSQPRREEYGDWEKELGQWLGLLRSQWFPRNPYKFHWTARFFFLFLGAFVYSVAFVLLVYAPTALPAGQALTVNLVVSLALVPSVPCGLFCAALLCWIDRRAGPARLFLSGLAFPAFAFVIVRYSIGEQVMTTALAANPGGVSQ